MVLSIRAEASTLRPPRRPSMADFLYDSDYYGDELPIWKTVNGNPHLVVPYSLTNNDANMPLG